MLSTHFDRTNLLTTLRQSREEDSLMLRFGVTARHYKRVRRLILSLYATKFVENTRNSTSEILVENRDFFIPHLHSTPPLYGRRRNIAIGLAWKNYNGVITRW